MYVIICCLCVQQRFSDKGGSRLSFDDLLIKPVQRIPRYMLFIKDLLKYTTVTHPDHTQLSEALEEMTALAVKVNENEKKSHLLHQLRELLLTSDGLAEVCNIFIVYYFITHLLYPLCNPLPHTHSHSHTLVGTLFQ